jgi:hypothetical protein
MLAFLGIIFWFALPVADIQTGQKIDPAKLPSIAATVSEFVPPGWMIEAQVEGDLNREGVSDLAVTLVEKLPADADKDNPPERQRALLILFKATDGKLSRAALAEKVLLCTRCGGAFYGVAETPANVAISNGVVIVKQDYGSRELTEELFRFRYDPEAKRFVLIGADVKTFDRATGSGVTESTNYLTGVKLVTRTKLNQKTDKTVITSNAQQRVNRGKKFIEDVANGYK